MKPNEFWNLTYREIYKYVDSNSLQRVQEYKEQVILFDALGNKIIGAIGAKRPKNVSLVSDTFKYLFKEELKDKPQSIEEQIRNLRSRG